MNNQQGSKRISSGVIAAVSAAVIVTGGGIAWLTSNQSPISIPPFHHGTTQPTPPRQEQTPSVYWLKPTDTNFHLDPQPMQIAATQPNQALEKAFETLLAGPTEGTNSTTIPPGTKLLAVKTANNEVHVNLSEEFTTGGGTASMIGRLGQVIYTATSVNPDAKVYIEVEGEQLELLGGEGLILEQPMTRESFQQNYPL